MSSEIVQPHPRRISWIGASSLALGGSNQSIFLIGALIASQGTAALPLLAIGLLLSYMATPGWIELSCMFPNRVGGIAATCAEAFRPYNAVLANLTGVCYWWGWVPTCGLTAIFSADAIHQWYLPGIPVKVLACVFVLVFMGVNLCGLKWAVRVAVPIACIAGLLALGTSLIPIFAGTVNWHQASDFHLISPFSGVFGRLTSSMAGLYLIGFAAPAFEAAACHIGEMKDPRKDQPRAMWFSGGVASIYFILIPVVWLGVFGSARLEGNLASLLGPTFAPLVGSLAKSSAIWFIALNMFSGTIQPLSGASRTLSQLSEDGLLPRTIGYRHPTTDAPMVAIVITAVFSIGFLLAGDPTSVIAAANLTYLIGIALPSIAVWVLRRNEPDRPRSYRASNWGIRFGVIAAFVWLASTVLGFEQFGLPVVIFGLGLAYSGSIAYAWRIHQDRKATGVSGPRRSIHFKLTGALLAVLTLDGVGYLIAVSNVRSGDLALVAILKDLFVTVGLLTITVGLVLPGMIANTAEQVAEAANRLAKGTLTDLTNAMEALSSGELERARFVVDINPVQIRSRDEFGQMAEVFNSMQGQVERVAMALETAVADANMYRNELEQLVSSRTGELSEAYDRLKTSRDQRIEILNRMRALTTLIGTHAGGHPDVGVMCSEVAGALGTVMGADAVVVQLADEHRQLSSRGTTWQRTSLDVNDDAGVFDTRNVSPSYLAELNRVLGIGDSVILNDQSDLNAFIWGQSTNDDSEQAGCGYIICPFFSNDSELIGAISLARTNRSSSWGELDVALVETVAADLARGIISARLIDDQQRILHQMQVLDRTKDEMLSTFSHEIRTPLSSIVAYVELLQDDPEMNSSDNRMLDVIQRNANRLSLLIEDILTLSHLGSEVMGVVLVPVSMDPIAASVCEALAPAFEDKEIQVEVQTNCGGAQLLGDHSQLERLCFNLLSNAIKFTPHGGKVLVSTEVIGDEIVLTVSDNGIGISLEDRDQIFSRFYRGSNAVRDAIPGTGLGLAIVEAIVAHHEGTIQALDNPEGGTSFVVRLPLIGEKASTLGSIEREG